MSFSEFAPTLTTPLEVETKDCRFEISVSLLEMLEVFVSISTAFNIVRESNISLLLNKVFIFVLLTSIALVCSESQYPKYEWFPEYKWGLS